MNSSTFFQLPLGVQLNDDATHKNFYLPEDSPNAQVLDMLRLQANGTGEQFIYVWGEQTVGLTHLLQASCHYADLCDRRVQYLPMKEVLSIEPEGLLEGLESVDMICIDDIDIIAGHAQWETAIFHFYNKLREQGKSLLVSANSSPREVAIQLPDLRSRFQWGMTYHIEPLSDEDKQQSLIKRAGSRGIELSAEVASFIIQRTPRDMRQLFVCLDQLDNASLSKQRKLTIPFVKQVLNL